MSTPNRDDTWASRRAYWQRRLKRLMLDAEPIEEQLARYRRVTWGLTLFPLGMGLLFLALFTAFGAPGTGAIVVAVLLVPIAAFAWWDDWRLRSQAWAYLKERSEYERSREREILDHK